VPKIDGRSLWRRLLDRFLTMLGTILVIVAIGAYFHRNVAAVVNGACYDLSPVSESNPRFSGWMDQCRGAVETLRFSNTAIRP
jgi:hypothetical protein